MRTTIRLDDDLLAEVKKLAAGSGKTLTSIIEDALREVVARRRGDTPRKRIRFPTDGRGGLMPGVNLDDSINLIEIMEDPDDPH